jgi:hypothetical protein
VCYCLHHSGFPASKSGQLRNWRKKNYSKADHFLEAKFAALGADHILPERTPPPVSPQAKARRSSTVRTFDGCSILRWIPIRTGSEIVENGFGKIHLNIVAARQAA